MTARFFCFFFSLCLYASCGGRKEGMVNGVSVPVKLLERSDRAGYDYTGNLHKALSQDEEALRSLLTFSNQTESAEEEAHSAVLHQILQRVGDEAFAKIVGTLIAEDRMALLGEMQSRGTKWKGNFPKTVNHFFPEKVLGEHHGTYVFSRSGPHTFQNCKSPSERWIAIDESGQVEVSYLKVLGKPYPGQAILAKAKGFFTPVYAEVELPNNFAGFFVVSEIMDLSKKNPTNTCVPYELWATGKEGNWYLQISSAERLIEFKSPQREMLHRFPFSEGVETDTARLYASVNENTGDNIRIVVKEELDCKSINGEFDFSKKVNVVMNGASFSGCGFSNIAEK